jgi:hypothetical protein
MPVGGGSYDAIATIDGLTGGPSHLTKKRPALRRAGVALLTTVLVAGGAGAFGAAQPAAAAGLTAPVLSWAYTDSADRHATHANPTDDVPLGAWQDPAGATHLSRVYVTFDVSAFSAKHILVAHVFAEEVRASDCQDRAI